MRRQRRRGRLQRIINQGGGKAQECSLVVTVNIIAAIIPVGSGRWRGGGAAGGGFAAALDDAGVGLRECGGSLEGGGGAELLAGALRP